MDGSNKNWWEQLIKGSQQPSVTKGMTGTYTGLGGIRTANTNFVPPGTLESQRQMGMPTSGMTGSVIPPSEAPIDMGDTLTDMMRPGYTRDTVSNKIATPTTKTTGTAPVVTNVGGATGGITAPTFTPPTSAVDWTQNLANLTAQGQQLAGATRAAQQQNIQQQYAEQLKAIQTAARQQQISEQQARQQIAEQAFTRERQLLETAAQRGLGASGIEQLARVQQRTATGQQINQLAQQSGVQREQLANALSQAAAQKGAALNQAEINYLTTNLQLQQAQFQQGLSLDDRARAQAYQDFQAKLASAEFASGQDYIAWQKSNAKEQARLLGVKNKQDVLAVLADPNLSEDFKNAWIQLNTDAGFITDAEGKDWISKNLKTIVPTEDGQPTDYTSQLSTQAVNLILKGGEKNWLGVQKPITDKQTALNSVWSVKNQDGTTTLVKGDAVLDKNNPQSPVYAFRTLEGYAEIEPDFNITPGGVSIGFKYNGKGYDTFAKASEAYQLDQIRKG